MSENVPVKEVSAMGKKKRKRHANPKPEVVKGDGGTELIKVMSGEEATVRAARRIAWKASIAVKGGLHGSTKYNRREADRSAKKAIEEGLRDRDPSSFNARKVADPGLHACSLARRALHAS